MEDNTITLYSNAMIKSYGKTPMMYDLEYIHFGLELEDLTDFEINALKKDFDSIKKNMPNEKFKIYFPNVNDLIKESTYIDNDQYLENIYLKIRKEDELVKIPDNSCKNIIVNINNINELSILKQNNKYDITLSINNINELTKKQLEELSENYNIKGILINSINYADTSNIWTEYLEREKNRLCLDSNLENIEHEVLITNDIFDTEIYEKIIDKVNEIFSEINLSRYDSDVDKFYKIYDYIIKNTTYDFKTLNNNTIENQTVYGALFNNEAVCEGYCKVMKLLLNVNNIECNIIGGGSSKEEGGHLWNQVKIDCAWYNADATVDSIRIKEGKEPICCLVSDDKLLYKSDSLISNKCIENYATEIINKTRR